ncbi:glycoside hydrolase family 3 C-terminal domain-containing protein [Saccharothrix syringae]|uniref:Exo-alpha-(1->6)-L-arabinopyranosidase n=1 Tax=Saccharothrix syringae TaxID=103733 RepID=A0A5Q0H415_SACSY|nr:glycoside hydrolase family 3 C-terminal domain-containing protein [Saccharothrix syringae]QFZ20634.1 glycosyl hydrolase [Saccharothrix syringae]
MPGIAEGVPCTRLLLEDKVALGSGASFWTTRAFPAAGIPSLTLTDGPHGLRAQGESGDHLGLADGTAATCFPTASALASSWDVGLVAEVGRAIGLEAVDQGVHVVLGPGVNMKRNPLCGRNFEYFSEDPLLSGKLAAAWIRGVQSTGTGTSLKHFALNNQELKRMSTDVRVDERALHEYYLPAFEIAVEEGDPTTVMCAYNRVEGVYCSDNRRLLTGILRERWGFRGAVVTDWGAMNDRPAAYLAGTDLEMPGNGGVTDAEVRRAVTAGLLDERVVDESVERLLALVARTTGRDVEVPADLHDRHHELARRAAVESAMLLKNDGGALPLQPGGRVALLGALAGEPRYQGTGSSRVNPTRVVSLRDGVGEYAAVDCAPGYRLVDEPDAALLDEAVRLAEQAEAVVVCVGLTEISESEGFDREHMRIPANQVALLESIAHLAERVVLVVVGGSAVEMPWQDCASAVLHVQLAGQAGGAAAADLLFGAANPSGKLAETYPLVYDDVVSSGYFGVDPHQTPYLESMYCGYRYFDSADKPVRHPFGHGLSYTTFAYSDLRVVRRGDDVEVTFTVTNTGGCDGAEVAQLYVAPRTGGAYRPVQELKAFTKLALTAGESRGATLTLDRRAFAIHDPEVGDRVVEAGTYEIRVGASSRDIRLRAEVQVEGTQPRRSRVADWYYTLTGTPTPEDFLTVHAPYPVLDAPRKGTFDLDSSILEMKDSSLACRVVHFAVERTVAKRFGGKVDYDDVRFKMLMYSAADLPMRAMVRMSDGVMTPRLARFLVDSANGHTLRGLWALLRRRA